MSDHLEIDWNFLTQKWVEHYSQQIVVYLPIYICSQWNRQSFFQIMVYRLFGAKPLSVVNWTPGNKNFRESEFNYIYFLLKIAFEIVLRKSVTTLSRPQCVHIKCVSSYVLRRSTTHYFFLHANWLVLINGLHHHYRTVTYSRVTYWY